MSEHPWKANGGGCPPIMAGNPEQSAVKNLLHGHAMGQGFSRPVQRMYWEVCNSFRGGDAFCLGDRDSLRLLESYTPPVEDCPCFIRGLTGLGGGDWLAIEGERREPVLFSFGRGPSPLPEGAPRDAFSMTGVDGGYLFLPQDYRTLTRVDRAFNPVGSHDLGGLGPAAKWVYLSATDAGFALTTKPQKSVVFLDREVPTGIHRGAGPPVPGHAGDRIRGRGSSCSSGPEAGQLRRDDMGLARRTGPERRRGAGQAVFRHPLRRRAAGVRPEGAARHGHGRPGGGPPDGLPVGVVPGGARPARRLRPRGRWWTGTTSSWSSTWA